MKFSWSWVETKFWWLWGANLFLALLVVGAFILGWVHETVTAPNIPAWCGILLFVIAIVAGSLRLRWAGRGKVAVWSLLILPSPIVIYAVGGFLFGIFYLVLSFVASLFGHGRGNCAADQR